MRRSSSTKFKVVSAIVRKLQQITNKLSKQQNKSQFYLKKSFKVAPCLKILQSHVSTTKILSSYLAELKGRAPQ